jgi:hypothetical protein
MHVLRQVQMDCCLAWETSFLYITALYRDTEVSCSLSVLVSCFLRLPPTKDRNKEYPKLVLARDRAARGGHLG